jgi:hypothetical protein
MPGPYDFPQFSDSDREYFRSFMGPEEWQQIGGYGRGADVPKIKGEDLWRGQSLSADDQAFLKLFLDEVYKRQDKSRQLWSRDQQDKKAAGQTPFIR